MLLNTKTRPPKETHRLNLPAIERQAGFIPMIVLLLFVIAAVIWFVFLRVDSANG